MARTESRAVLFIGNSYTNRNDLPGLLAKLALASRPPLELTTERVIANGVTLKTHWDRGIAAEAIQSKPWDFVVLQDQARWARKDAPERQMEITSACSAAAAGSDAIVVPVEALAIVSKNHPEIVLYDRDGSHPSKVGT